MQPVERRGSLRYKVELAGTVTTQGGYRCNIQVTNISASGLQFNVAHAEIPHLIPKFAETFGVTPVAIELDIELVDRSESLTIVCGIVYLQRHSLSLASVGCRFESFLGDSAQRLESYLSCLPTTGDSCLSLYGPWD
jgi:hypothetical protein